MELTLQQKDILENVLPSLKSYTKYECVDQKGQKHRFCVERTNGVVVNAFVFAKGKSRRGYRYNLEHFVSQFTPIIKTDEDFDREWHKRIDKAVKCLENSGLWPDVLQTLKNMSTMTLQDKKALKDLSSVDYSISLEKRYIAHSDKLKASELFTKYPFAFNTDEDGLVSIKTDYIYEFSEVNLKSIYFGKYINSQLKDEIATAISSHKDYSCSARTNYDVSFNYRADLNKAWYSEEYKDCGNGHYYIALDHNTAMFCEDD